MNYIHGLLIVMFDIVCLYLDFAKNWSGSFSFKIHCWFYTCTYRDGHFLF